MLADDSRCHRQSFSLTVAKKYDFHNIPDVCRHIYKLVLMNCEARNRLTAKILSDLDHHQQLHTHTHVLYYYSLLRNYKVCKNSTEKFSFTLWTFCLSNSFIVSKQLNMSNFFT